MKVEMRKLNLYMILPQNPSGIDDEMQENKKTDEGERELLKKKKEREGEKREYVARKKEK